jgi:isopenicillin N synthase-like dioxygenase
VLHRHDITAHPAARAVAAEVAAACSEWGFFQVLLTKLTVNMF